MISNSALKLLALFVLTLSITLLPSVARGDPVPTNGTTPATQWVPSGPSADKIFYTFYDSDLTELNQICAGQVSTCVPSIDLTDVPLPGSVLKAAGCTVNCADTDPRFFVTTPTIEIGELETEFNQASTLWGVTFCNGRDGVTNGVTTCYDGIGGTPITASCPNVPAPHQNDCTFAAKAIRQGIAHLINKVQFVLDDVGFIGPNAAVLDNFLTPAQLTLHSGYNLYNQPGNCSGTAPFGCANPNVPGQTCVASGAGCNAGGSYCVTPGDAGSVSNFPGQQAVDCSTAGAYPIGGVCKWDIAPTSCISAFHNFNDATDSLGFNSPASATNPGRDFCAAADDFMAAGLATAKDPTTCELVVSSESTQLTSPSVPVIFKGRNSLGRHNLSVGLSAAICELIAAGATTCPSAQEQLLIIGLATAHAQVFRTGCTTLSAGPACATIGPNTPQNAGGSFTQSWNIYAGGFFFTTIASNEQWSQADSSFASNYCGFDSAGNPLVPGTAGTGSPGEEAPNYEYICNHTHDIWAEKSQFLTSPAAAEAALQVAMDIYGNHTLSLPIWTPSIQYPYTKGWQGVSNENGVGTAQGNNWSLLNAWNPNPAVAGPTIRWGQKDATDTLNPYLEDTVVDGDLTFAITTPGPIWDALLTENPQNPVASNGGVLGWMVNFFRLEKPGQFGTECPSFFVNSRGNTTVGACVKVVLRGDIPWHDMVTDCAVPPGTPQSSICLQSHAVTANDVLFSYASFNATAGLYTSSTANTIDIVGPDGTKATLATQLPSAAFCPPPSTLVCNGGGQPEQLIFLLHSFNAWALYDLASVPIVPQHIWVQQTAPSLSNGVRAPCLTLDTASCLADPARLSGTQSDPVSARTSTGNGLFIGSGAFVCSSGDLSWASGATPPVIGGGCTSSGTGAIPFGGSATFRRFAATLVDGVAVNSLNPNFAYFRTNDKFEQFQWAAYVPSTNSAGNQATASDTLSAQNSCKPDATRVGGVKSVQACAHWNNPSAGLACVATAGACIGAAAGGHGSLPNLPGPVTTQIQQWITRGQWAPGASDFNHVYGAQGIPQTLYADGSSEGSFTSAASTTTVSTTNSTTADVTVTVTLSGSPDNNFTGSVTVNFNVTSSKFVTGTITGPTSLALTPSAPSATTTVHIVAVVKPGTYAVDVTAFVGVLNNNYGATTFPATTVIITVTQT